MRGLAVQSGQTLAQNINQLAGQVTSMQTDLNSQITSQAGQINQLVGQIQQLNVQIAAFQGGVQSSSDAVGLVDQRQQALTSLSQIVNINVQQQASGEDAVYVGGDYLVFDGTTRQVAATTTLNSAGQPATQLVMADTQSPLQATSGQYAGLVNARDQILGGFLDQLNSFSNVLSTEFNKVYASGQGLTGYTTVTSQNGVNNANAALENAGLPSTPVNGSFQIVTQNSTTGASQTTNINVDLDGLGQDTTLNQVATQINNISGLTASVNASGKLTIASQSPNLQFSFANDNSGLLTALGINTFFTGNTAASLGVSTDVANDPTKFAASQGGVGQDTQNAVALAGLDDAPAGRSRGQLAFGTAKRDRAERDGRLRCRHFPGQCRHHVSARRAKPKRGRQRRQHRRGNFEHDQPPTNLPGSAQLVNTLNQLLQLLTEL